MKNAKQIKFITLGLISAFTLSGCIVFPWNSSGISGTNSSTKNTSPKSGGSDLSSLEPHFDDEEEDEEDIVNPIQKTKFNYNYKDYSKHCFLDNDYTPSVGNPKLLVIPVWFTDSEACIMENHKEDVRKDIEMAYFGTREETGWHSVKTYYSKMSQGRCSLDGVVTDWYEIGEAMDAYGNSAEKTTSLVNTAADWYFSQAGSLPRSYFDSDSNGYLDGVMLIYAAPDQISAYNDWDDQNDGRENFWAYTSWTMEEADQDTPSANAFFWASYDFMYDEGAANARTGLYFYGGGNPTVDGHVDAHTFIHEMGHMFGLPDYYDYSGQYSPAGGFSMQDHNVGGHDPYSALALGWSDPYVPEDSCTLTIRPFQGKGRDLVLLQPNGFNVDNSPFDEYVLLELYTPTGLNRLDSETQYTTYRGSSQAPQGPMEIGIRVWHVDARLVKIKTRGTSYFTPDASHPKKVPDEDNLYFMMTNSYDHPLKDMSGRLSVCGAGYYNYNILQLIRNDRSTTYHCDRELEGNDLFGNNSQFTCSQYSSQFVNGRKLNSGDTLGWTVNVSITTGERAKDARATLTLTRD